MITLEFDDRKVTDAEATELAKALRHIVAEVTRIEDVFVCANSARIKVQVAPIEVFVWMDGREIKDGGILMAGMKSRLSDWKQTSGYEHSINLSLIPMNWRVEIGI